MHDRATRSEKRGVLLVVRWPLGGIRTFLRYVYSRFDPQRWHFTIIAPQHGELDALANDLEECDVDIVFTSPKPSALKFSMIVLKQLMKKRYDFVHSHGFTSAVCATVPTLLMLKKHIITSHDVINAIQFNGKKGKLARILLEVTLRIATKVHSVSRDAQANLLSFFPHLLSEKFIVIPNGIEIERFIRAKPRNLRQELEIENAFLIGFFGRFMGQKGFRYLIDAIESIIEDDATIRNPMVLAFGWGGFIEREKRNISEKKLGKYFMFMPFEPNVASIIKALDVVVMPSLWEACGLLAMETMVCGTPLIATNCIGLREVIKGSPTINISTNDAEALAQNISFLMKNDCSKPFKKFSEKAVKKFDVKQQVDGIIRLYKTIDGIKTLR